MYMFGYWGGGRFSGERNRVILQLEMMLILNSCYFYSYLSHVL